MNRIVNLEVETGRKYIMSRGARHYAPKFTQATANTVVPCAPSMKPGDSAVIVTVAGKPAVLERWLPDASKPTHTHFWDATPRR